MPTVAEIRDKAARKLGVLAFGQTLSNRYSADLTAAYSEVYAELRELNLVNWTLTGTIPDEVVEPVVALVARARVDEYGVSNDRYQRILNSAQNAETSLRRVIHDPYFSSSEDAEFY